MHAVFWAAASLAHAGSITGTGPYVNIQSAVTSGSGGDSVTYTDSFVLTINGGSGTGFFEPIARVQNTWAGTDASRASVAITCGIGCAGLLFTDYSNSTTYSWYGKGSALSFTYGVPIPIVLTLSASNCCDTGLESEASIDGFALFDPRGNQLVSGGTFAMAAQNAPEPGSFWLMAGSVFISVIVGRRALAFVRPVAALFTDCV